MSTEGERLAARWSIPELANMSDAEVQAGLERLARAIMTGEVPEHSQERFARLREVEGARGILAQWTLDEGGTLGRVLRTDEDFACAVREANARQDFGTVDELLEVAAHLGQHCTVLRAWQWPCFPLLVEIRFADGCVLPAWAIGTDGQGDVQFD